MTLIKVNFDKVTDNYYGSLPMMKNLTQIDALDQQQRWSYVSMVIEEMTAITAKALCDYMVKQLDTRTVAFIFSKLEPDFYSFYGSEQFDPVLYDSALEWLQYRIFIPDGLLAEYKRELITFSELLIKVTIAL